MKVYILFNGIHGDENNLLSESILKVFPTQEKLNTYVDELRQKELNRLLAITDEKWIRIHKTYVIERLNRYTLTFLNLSTKEVEVE